MVNNENKENKDSIGYKIGRIAGAVISLAIASCVVALMITLTYKLILWIL